MTAPLSPKVLTLFVLGAGLVAAGCGGKSSSYPDAVGTGGRTAGSGGSTGSGTGGATPGTGGAVATGGAGGAIAPGEPIPIASFAAEYLAASCAVSARCGFYPDVATCMATNTVSGGLLTLAADVAASTVTYDPAKAAACVASIRNGACGITAIVAAEVSPSPCAGVFTGKTAAGGACFVSGECAGTAACIITTNCTTACCMGTCVAPVAAGGNCANAPCVAGTYCRTTGTAANPISRCTAQAATEGAACDAADGCAPPLFCALDPGGQSASCVKSLPATGAGCDPDTGCDDAQDFCNASKVCARRVAAGQACSATVNSCAGYAFCSGTTCTSWVAEGGACQSDPDSGANNCMGALLCPAATSVCTKPAAPTSCR